MPADAGVWRVVVAGLLACAAAYADGERGADDAPAPEFLEFLGSFETADGAWVDPLLLGSQPEGTDQAGTAESGREDE